MISETLLMATVWYVPGWMRTEVPQEGVMPALSNAFPKAECENLTLVGHSLGGRIVALMLARLAMKDIVLSRNVNLQISRHLRLMPCGKYDIMLVNN